METDYTKLTKADLKAQLTDRKIKFDDKLVNSDLAEMLLQDDEDKALAESLLDEPEVKTPEEDSTELDKEDPTKMVAEIQEKMSSTPDWESEYFFEYMYDNQSPDPKVHKKYLVSGKPTWFDTKYGQEIGDGFIPEWKEYFDTLIPAKYGVKYFANVMDPKPAGILITVVIPLKHSIRDTQYLQEMRFQRHGIFVANLVDLNAAKAVLQSKLPTIIKFMKTDN